MFKHFVLLSNWIFVCCAEWKLPPTKLIYGQKGNFQNSGDNCPIRQTKPDDKLLSYV